MNLFTWIKKLWRKYVQVPWWKYKLESRLQAKLPAYEAALQRRMSVATEQLQQRKLAIADFLEDRRKYDKQVDD